MPPSGINLSTTRRVVKAPTSLDDHGVSADCEAARPML
jgi:hypothetical protein